MIVMNVNVTDGIPMKYLFFFVYLYFSLAILLLDINPAHKFSDRNDNIHEYQRPRLKLIAVNFIVVHTIT